MPLYLYRITPTRPEMPLAPTEAETQIIGAHFAYLEAAYDAGSVHYVGRTATAPFLGIALFDADDDEVAARFLAADPAVAAGVFSGLTQPFAEALPFRTPVVPSAA